MLNVNKKVIGKMKDELHKGYMREFISLSSKVYAYEQVNVDKTVSEEKKGRGTNKAVTKKTLSFDHYRSLLYAYNRKKSIPYSVDTVEINKIALKNSDNKRVRSFNGITTYPYGTSASMVRTNKVQ